MKFNIWHKPELFYYEGKPSGICLESLSGEETIARVVFEGLSADYKQFLIPPSATSWVVPFTPDFDYESILVQYIPMLS